MTSDLNPLFADSLGGAIFSEDKQYRYALWRIWNEDLDSVMFIMLNPSTADEKKNDPTINKCIAYAKRWGYGAVFVCNLYAYRNKDPKVLEHVPDPVGPDCDQWIITVSKIMTLRIAAWGNGTISKGRVDKVRSLTGPLNCLEKSKSGNPKHPLYLRKNLFPRFF